MTTKYRPRRLRLRDGREVTLREIAETGAAEITQRAARQWHAAVNVVRADCGRDLRRGRTDARHAVAAIAACAAASRAIGTRNGEQLT
jgi:hypothetical protein